LVGVAGAAAPPWRHIPEAVGAAIVSIGEPIVLVGHSGGGMLLPAIAEALTVEVGALVFVDSFLPPAAGSLQLVPPAFKAQLRALADDGVVAPWSSWFGEEAMRELVADERLRAVLEAEMPRLPLSYFEATVPVPNTWTARRCAYLLLSEEPYVESAAEARARGWPVAHIRGGRHLAIATDPVAVTEALLAFERRFERPTQSRRDG
jgi:pimeloyl-ACP methyl ester carboxylesterase